MAAGDVGKLRLEREARVGSQKALYVILRWWEFIISVMGSHWKFIHNMVRLCFRKIGIGVENRFHHLATSLNLARFLACPVLSSFDSKGPSSTPLSLSVSLNKTNDQNHFETLQKYKLFDPISQNQTLTETEPGNLYFIKTAQRILGQLDYGQNLWTNVDCHL